MKLWVGLLVLLCLGFGAECKVFRARHSTGRYRMTYKDAHVLCKSLGAHLATPSELHDQWKNEKYEDCNCGWLLDKTVKYPMNSVIKSCGNKVAIHECSVSKADAYCFQDEVHTNCSQPLGMEMGEIPNSHIATSSYYRTWWGGYWYGYKARLHTSGMVNAWIPHDDSQREYLEINLSKPMALTGIVIQGAKRYGRSQYVKKYKVEYSKNRYNWKTFQDRDSQDVIFTDLNKPRNGYTLVRNMFWEPILTQYIRIKPYDWYKHIVLRVELLGCGMALFDRLDEIARDRMVTTTAPTTTTIATTTTTTAPTTITTAPTTTTHVETYPITTKPLVFSSQDTTARYQGGTSGNTINEREPPLLIRPGNKDSERQGIFYVEMTPPDDDYFN